MSIEIIQKIFDEYHGTSAEKLTLLALASIANDRGTEISPSVAEIGQATNLSTRQARRNIRKLEDQGVITVIGNQNGGKAGTTRHYQINPEMISRSKDMRICLGNSFAGGAA